jgi:hypothetical protein
VVIDGTRIAYVYRVRRVAGDFCAGENGDCSRRVVQAGADAVGSKFQMKLFRWMMGFCLFVCMLPLVGVLVTSVVANSLGCRVDEGSVHPCYLLGVSIGGALYTLGVMGWLMLVTLPMAAFLLLAWIVVEVMQYVGKRRGVIR